MYRNFYSYNDMPQIPRPDHNIQKSTTSPLSKKEEKHINTPENILKKLETDDILLIVVGLLLLLNGCDDVLLLVAIGFVFISGIL